MSFKIDSELSENQVEADVASYLGYITPIWSKRFRLISVDEQSTGADKLFNRFVPIFMQFKVSEGLNPKASILTQFLNKPLAKIIKYRKNNGLKGDPILYFELRKKAKTVTDYQHNILSKMHNPPLQYGIYVAPLSLKLNEYESVLNKDWHFKLYPFNPFRLKESELYDTISSKKLALGSNPFLRHHISIPAHTNITTHKHHYSFSKNGADLAWHGGKVIDGDLRLSSQLITIFNSFYSYKESGTYLSSFIKEINKLDLEGFPKLFDNNNTETEQLQYIIKLSNFLKFEHNIKLMFLVDDRSQE